MQSWTKAAWPFYSRHPSVTVLLSIVVGAEILVSVATWYGVEVLRARELNPLFGYSTLIEVGRPFFAFLLGLSLSACLKKNSQRLIGLGTLLGVALGDFSYDCVYIFSGVDGLGIVVGTAVACATLTACLLRINAAS